MYYFVKEGVFQELISLNFRENFCYLNFDFGMCIVSMCFICLGKYECLFFCFDQVLLDRSYFKLLMSGGGGYFFLGFIVVMDNFRVDFSFKFNVSILELYKIEELVVKKRKCLEFDF